MKLTTGALIGALVLSAALLAVHDADTRRQDRADQRADSLDAAVRVTNAQLATARRQHASDLAQLAALHQAGQHATHQAAHADTIYQALTDTLRLTLAVTDTAALTQLTAAHDSTVAALTRRAVAAERADSVAEAGSARDSADLARVTGERDNALAQLHQAPRPARWSVSGMVSTEPKAYAGLFYRLGTIRLPLIGNVADVHLGVIKQL